LSISTCFGLLWAHHQEIQLCLCDTWYLFFCTDDCLVCRDTRQSSILLVDYTEMHGEQNNFFFKVIPKKCKIGVLLCCYSQVLTSVGRMSVAQPIYTLKAAKFGTKSYEICEPSTGYAWSFIIYA